MMLYCENTTLFPSCPALSAVPQLGLSNPTQKQTVMDSQMFYTFSIKVSFLSLTDACPASQWGTSAILDTQKAERGRIAM
jgi:hypothetical protein